MSTRALALCLSLALAACQRGDADRQFPAAKRDVAPIVNDSFSTENARDRVGEAEEVMRLAGVKPGMWVADIGAGEGYYTVRLAPVVGAKGRVLAEDIVSDTRDKLAARVEHDNLTNVAVRLGKEDDPLLPPHTFDRIFMVHMYHEVTEPYEFLWHLRDGLKPDGLVVVVDAYRPEKRHGMPLEQLRCEMEALGLQPVDSRPLTGNDAYFATFRIAAPKPAPHDIKPCIAVGS